MKFSKTIIVVLIVGIAGVVYVSLGKKPDSPLRTESHPQATEQITSAEKPTAAQTTSPATSASSVPVSKSDIRYSKEPVPLTKTTKSNSIDMTPEERLPALVNNLIRIYGPSIAAMGLTADQEKKLRDLLIARSEAGYIAHDVVTEQKQRLSTDLKVSVDLARKAVDEEISQAFPPEIAQKIAYMIEASPYLAQVNTVYSRAFQEAGDPLKGEQAAVVAHVLLDAYGPDDYADQRVKAHAAEVDPATHLLPSEASALKKAEGTLSFAQVRAIEKKLAARNERILSADNN